MHAAIVGPEFKVQLLHEFHSRDDCPSHKSHGEIYEFFYEIEGLFYEKLRELNIM